MFSPYFPLGRCANMQPSAHSCAALATVADQTSGGSAGDACGVTAARTALCAAVTPETDAGSTSPEEFAPARFDAPADDDAPPCAVAPAVELAPAEGAAPAAPESPAESELEQALKHGAQAPRTSKQRAARRRLIAVRIAYPARYSKRGRALRRRNARRRYPYQRRASMDSPWGAPRWPWAW